MERLSVEPLHSPAVTPIACATASPDLVCAASFAQERMWFAEQVTLSTPAYNVPLVFRLEGSLDIAALEAALDELVRRHEVLRTTYRIDDDELLQVIWPGGSAGLRRVDLHAVTEGSRDLAAAQIADEEAATPFDLVTGPVVRSCLVDLGGSRFVLVVTVHHIAFDAWSGGVFLRELGALYNAFAEGLPSPLPDPRLQYADFAVWQRQRLASGELQVQLDYWRAKLAGAPDALDLGIGRERPARSSFRGDVFRMTLEPAFRSRVATLARHEGATPFMVMLACLKTLVLRYCAETDTVVGVPIAGRTRRELEGAVGFFVNTLALRSRLSPRMTFRDALADVRTTALEAYEHQELPFEKVVEALQPTRSLNHAPLLQVMLAFQPEGGEGLRLSGVRCERVAVRRQATAFDLAVTLWPTRSGLDLELEYSTDLFDQSTIARLAKHLRAIAEGAITNPQAKLRQLPLVGSGERARILRASAGRRFDDGAMTLHGLFEESVRSSREATAVVADRRLTYGDLDVCANGLAQRLHAAGVRRGDVVGICLPRVSGFVVSLLGVMKSGAAYLPLDPRTPLRRLRFMLEDSGASMLLTTALVQEALRDWTGRIEVLEGHSRFAEQSDRPPRVGVGAGDLAYITYTSGSTGAPKGVAIEHRNVLPFLRWSQSLLGYGPRMRTLQTLSYAFDFGAFELLATCCAGGELHLFEPGPLDLNGYVDYLNENRITAIHVTPSILRELVGLERRLEAVDLLHVGGEPLPWQLVDAARRIVSDDCRIVNGYGPTEAGIGCAAHEILASETRAGAIVPIGISSGSADLHVLDECLEPVPTGVRGELYIGGAGVGRGYVGRACLTAERFVPDALSGRPGARLYASGDMVRRRADGTLEYLGRGDEQVKVRGFRIELGEIETVLAQHPAVQEAVVTVRDHSSTGKRLDAYFLPAAGKPPAAVELRRFLSERLPEYMIPAAFVRIESVPRTSSGKVDRRALPDPSIAADATRGGAPRTVVERQLALIWEDVLGTGPIGLNDDFFVLGGHSLLAIKLAARIEETFGGRMPIGDLFPSASVERIASLLERRGDASDPVVVPLVRTGRAASATFVHPIGGEVFCYLELARTLRGACDAFGIRSPALAGAAVPYGIEEMAATYLAFVKASPAAGSSVVAGWSMGGLVALELARLRAAAEEQEPIVVVVDSVIPRSSGVSAADVSLATFASDMSSALGAPPPPANADLRTLVRHLERAGFDGADETRLERLFGVFRAHRRILGDYDPEPYPGRVVLVLSSRTARSSDVVEAWRRRVTSTLEVHVVPGDHYSLLRRPGVERVAAVVRAVLALPAAVRSRRRSDID